MNCSQINSRLIAYLHGEVSLVEMESIRTHLMVCTICQGELRTLSEIENRLERHIHNRTRQVLPAPYAWNTLQARVAQAGTGKSYGGFGAFSNRFLQQEHAARRLAFAMIVILILVLAAPPTRILAARLGDWVGTWFHFKTPGTQSSLSVGGFEAFTPYSPQYLPDGFDSTGFGGTTSPDLDSMTLTYENGSQFISLVQSKGTGLDELPSGPLVEVGGKWAVFVQDFATSSEDLQQKIPSIPIVANLDWGTTSLLVWRFGEIQIELVSNLPKEEMLKVARSLVPAESNKVKMFPDYEP